MSGIWIGGLDELTVELGAEAVLAPDRARKVIAKNLNAMKGTMKSFAPVHEGKMRDSISYETRLIAGGAEGEVGPTATRDGFPYPAAVEYGTSKMAPQAFAVPAADRHEGEFVTEMRDVCEL